ncbi:SUKH-3 domain-containing protein, partial [Streptomyces sp. NPDC058369]|uniref:SUKH-3 domain-containing protein n=1 Tax=Streptomyces sp. NPDC058369 TaxID=3346462 RepID=UPI00364E7D0D
PPPRTSPPGPRATPPPPPRREEGDGQAVLAIDVAGRVYSIDHTGDWYLGQDIDAALATLVTGLQPERLVSG